MIASLHGCSLFYDEIPRSLFYLFIYMLTPMPAKWSHKMWGASPIFWFTIYQSIHAPILILRIYLLPVLPHVVIAM